jgi:hypothetical protein
LEKPIYLNCQKKIVSAVAAKKNDATTIYEQFVYFGADNLSLSLHARKKDDGVGWTVRRWVRGPLTVV